ncbi:MAG: hypothetical protein WCO62_00335 [Betaproteobacteria bacterium]
MPSVSKKQHNFMEAVAHNPGFAKKAGIPQKVGKHFHEADKMKRKKFADGGTAESAKADAAKKLKALQDANESDYRSKTDIFGALGMPDRKAAAGRQDAQRDSDFAMWRARKLNPPTSGMKKGGHVKHANELEGKAKETKSIAHEEMKALKRGHAPKEIMEHEKAEHTAMGYKKGGKIETPHKGFAMAESKGGRKPPHGKHTSEGDTKLKGFGMGKGEGHGRKVTKAATPKDEMPRKGFAMKKGGHVQHMKKGRRVKAPRMAQATPDADMPGLPGALASSLGGMGGGPNGPPGGSPMPTMAAKKGGHVMHHNAHHGHGHQIHHHHHYAKGGHVKKEPESGPHMTRKVHEAHSKPRKEDGVAQRGHTRGKQVKMAHGGHVGSHPSRRADGIASKGHTSCKMV